MTTHVRSNIYNSGDIRKPYRSVIYLKGSFTFGMELPGKTYTTCTTGARVFVKESCQHRAGYKLLKNKPTKSGYNT